MDDDALERLARKIDTKDGGKFVERRPLYNEGPEASREWAHEDHPMRKKGMFSKFTPLEILFTGSIIFFVGAAAVAGLLLFSGDNTVSTKNVGIAVSGPTSIRAGDVVTLQIIITNRNAVPMNLTDMLVEFPSGTRSEADVSVDLPRIRDSLGTIQPGETVNRTVKAVLFGTQGAPVDVKVTAEYRVPSSNAVFYSDTNYHATISQSPASISVDSLKEAVSGQPLDITAHVTSNATENLSGMLLVATYPPGFTFISASPKPVSGTSVWDLGDIEPKGTRTITIHGTFTGENGDDRVVHFTTGTKQKANPSAIAAPLAASDVTVTVAKPFVSVILALENNTSGAITSTRGTIIHGEVRWANNLPVRVQNVQIAVKMNGGILDKNTIRSGQGFYRSSDSTLLFSPETDPRLADVAPGEEQVSVFQFASLPPGTGSFQSPQIVLTATVTADRSSENQVPDTVTSSAQATIQFTTDLVINSALTHNTGPQPPKVDQETSYTVSWIVNNSANAIANTVVTGILPSYVRWVGSPSTSDVAYNTNGRTVTWTIGDMSAGTTKTASFQVAITPSLTQVNNAPTIVSDVRVSAFDRFIRGAIQVQGAPVMTGTGTSPQLGPVVP